MTRWVKTHWDFIILIIALIAFIIVLQRNPSGFQNIAWYLLVALTAIYAWATVRLVGENQRTINEMRQSRLDAVKPTLSLQPRNFYIGGGFGDFYLINSGGVARDIEIDIVVTNPPFEKALFLTSLSHGDGANLYDIQVENIRKAAGSIKVSLSFKDSYGQSLQDSLLFNFGELESKGREVISQSSEIYELNLRLKEIEREISNIKLK